MAFSKNDLIYKNAYDSVMNAQNTKNADAIAAARKAVGSLNGTDGSFAIGEFSKQLDGITPNDYTAIAKAQLQPTVDSQLTTLKDSLAKNLAAYDNQKGALQNGYNNSVQTTNTNFDNQVNNQNIATKNNMNTFSNSVLGRGLGRSTVATSGLGEMQNINTRLVNNIDTNRTNALQGILNTYNTNLAGIDSNIANANSDYNNKVADINNNMANQIMTLARTLSKDDFDRYVQQAGIDANTANQLYQAGQDEITNNLNERKLADQEAQQKFDNNLATQQLAQKLANANASSGGGSYSSGYSPSGNSGSNGSNTSNGTVSNGVYKLGSSGPDIANIQKILGVPADGVYGPQTKQSVMDFQKAYGLPVDGIVGPDTLALLNLPPAGRIAALKNAAKAAKDAGDFKAASQLNNAVNQSTTSFNKVTRPSWQTLLSPLKGF